MVYKLLNLSDLVVFILIIWYNSSVINSEHLMRTVMDGKVVVCEPKSLEWINNEINRLSALVEKEPPRLMEYLPKQKPGEPAMPVPMEFMERVFEDEKVNNAWSTEQRKIKQELDVLSRDLAELQWMNSKHRPGNNICVYELPSHKMYLFLLHNDGIILMLDSDDLPDLILKESAQDPKATFIGKSDFERRQVFANICERLYTMEEIIAPDYAKRIMDAQPHINQFTVPAMYALAQKTGILIVDNDGIHRDLMSDVARAYFALNKFYFARFEKTYKESDYVIVESIDELHASMLYEKYYGKLNAFGYTLPNCDAVISEEQWQYALQQNDPKIIALSKKEPKGYITEEQAQIILSHFE